MLVLERWQGPAVDGGSRAGQLDSVKLIDGIVPPLAVQAPRLRLLVSPVVPAFAAHVGADMEPSLTATCTVTDEPVLKSARDPPALPITLNSDSVQTVP